MTATPTLTRPARPDVPPGRPRSGRRGRFEAWVERWSEVLFALVVLTWLWTLSVHARVPMSTALITIASLTLVRGLGTPGGRAEVDRLPVHPDYYAPAALTLAYLAALAWTEARGYAWERLEFAAQALLIPVAFFVWRRHFVRWGRAYLAVLIGFAAAAAVGVSAYALSNYGALVVALGQGRAVPVPLIQHVPFAVLEAFGALIGLHLATDRRGGWAWWGAVCALACVVALHLLAVRTGLVLFYIGAAGYGLRWALGPVRPAVALVAVPTVLLATGALALQVPSVERRVAYARYDLARATGARAGMNSDGGRVLSFRAAAGVIADDPVLGAGAEGIAVAMEREYDRLGHAGLRHGSTNQWLFSWSHAGLLGFLGVCCVLLTPLLEGGWWRRPLVAEWIAMMAAWWMVESPLETDVGPSLALGILYLLKSGTSSSTTATLIPGDVAPTGSRRRAASAG